MPNHEQPTPNEDNYRHWERGGSNAVSAALTGGILLSMAIAGGVYLAKGGNERGPAVTQEAEITAAQRRAIDNAAIASTRRLTEDTERKNVSAYRAVIVNHQLVVSGKQTEDAGRYQDEYKEYSITFG